MSCYSSTGVCNVCNDGKYGERCELNCTYADNCTRCYSDGSRCFSCNAGKYGETCEHECPSTCYSTNCIKDTGVCSKCPAGMYGAYCTKDCPSICLQSCNQVSGGCTDTCQRGKFGEACDKDCVVKNCFNNQCDRVSGHCQSLCNSGFYGDNCSLSCSPVCLSRQCDRDGYCLYGCINRFSYGEYCHKLCDVTNCDLSAYSVCEQRTGRCSACAGGFYGSQCEKRCSVEKCLSNCDRFSGTCSSCKYGFYSDNCSMPCPTGCLNNECNRYDGSCKRGCLNGLYGLNCDLSCNTTNCLNQECERYTGRCKTCSNGFYGMQCQKICSNENCRYNCNRFTGSCSYCQFGKYGIDCELTCPGSCLKGSCDRYTGKCPGICYNGIPCVHCPAGLHGEYCLKCLNTNCFTCESGGNCTSCRKGYFGKSCDAKCSYNCVHSNNTPECHMDTGECLQGCYFGDGCHNSCLEIDAQCLECSKTEKASFECFRCKPGFYISQINDNRTICVPCDHCLEQTCSMETGVCQIGCFFGYWGERCLNSCKERCAFCDRLSGVCIIYTNYTDICRGITCNENCKANANGTSCDTINGQCLHGCEDETFYGPTCDIQCSEFCNNGLCEHGNGHCRDGCSLNQLVGAFCNETCSSNCFQNQCDSTNGRCLNGCRQGYYGTKCDSRCPDNCAFGIDQSASTCYEIGGACKYGCTSGFFGTRCDIIESSKDRVTMAYAIGGGLGLVGVLVLIIVFIGFFKRRISRRKPESDVRRPNELDSSGTDDRTELDIHSQASGGESTTRSTTSDSYIHAM